MAFNLRSPNINRTDRQIDRQADRQTNRQTERQTDRQTASQTYTKITSYTVGLVIICAA